MKSVFLQVIITGIFCVIALIGYSVWYSVIASKSASVAELQERIDIQTKTVDRISATRATLSQIATDEAIIRDYFVSETEVVPFINSLESRGRARGASVQVLSVSNTGTNERPALTLALSITGTFDAVMRTVGSIEYAPYELSVTSLSITKEDVNRWEADLKLRVGSIPASRTKNVQTTSSFIHPHVTAYAHF